MTTPDTPALAALREAENEARFRASHWCAQPDDLDAYRDAVAARVREEEAEKRAGRCACGAILRPRQRERTTCRACQTERIREGVRLSHRRKAALPPEGDHAE